MESKNGSQYAQNYDVIVKWLADALRGQTLEVIGVKTGRIEEVFGFEPVEIAVRAGRVDVMLRDEHGNLFHLEEQRNLLLSDLYRSAAYHELWEDIKMLDVLEVAREKGMEEGIEAGKNLGIQEGKNLGAVETHHKLLLNAIYEKFGLAPLRIADQIKKIENQNVLDILFSQVFRCADMAAFENVLRQVVADDNETQGAF